MVQMGAGFFRSLAPGPGFRESLPRQRAGGMGFWRRLCRRFPDRRVSQVA